MNTESLWGELSLVEESNLPVTILKEQATVLGEATNKILLARVVTKETGILEIRANGPKGGSTAPSLVHTLSIVAPALSNYTYGVLSVTHKLLPFYPLIVTKLADKTHISCKDEAIYVAALKEILSSEQVHRIVAALLAQSKAAA